MISSIKKLRRDFRPILLCVFAFTLTATLSFLMIKNQDKTSAADLSKFDAGDIMSDETMSDYNSMSESSIQNFLKSKNACNDTRLWLVGNKTTSLDMSGTMNWHIYNGHFVCMADENFDGESAAHIIWQAAQDYKINPQVLIVLLQKEQGLITDTLPRSGQYRAATGFGCPDTAPCATEYYGLKNQIRHAANLFRTVLNGGWTNYPVGNNYIQYSPNAACGGSVVNIKNRATSALYRYTPYQPNAGALAAGYGTCNCGAYGNRNFYAYFTDWFGDTHAGFYQADYSRMDTPRIMTAAKSTATVATNKRGPSSILNAGDSARFTHRTYINGELCLKTKDDIEKGLDRCYYFKDFTTFTGMKYYGLDSPRQFFIPAGTKKINTASDSVVDQTTTVATDTVAYFQDKSYWFGDMCLRTDVDARAGTQACIKFSDLKPYRNISYESMDTPRIFMTTTNARYYRPDIYTYGSLIPAGTRLAFNARTYVDGNLCLQTVEDNNAGSKFCVFFGVLSDTTSSSGKEYNGMDSPRYMEATKDLKYTQTSGLYVAPETVAKGEKLFFSQRSYTTDGLCLRTSEDVANNVPRCITFDSLKNATVFDPMDNPRRLVIDPKSTIINTSENTSSEANINATALFVDRTYWNGKLCVRTESDAAAGRDVCYDYFSLKSE